ncbi:MAG: biopolymer transporter ExbD [Planctomycetes bacterium]|nr:biopolymer transporter ExbD [Planctomycetota bacterium]
MAIRFRCQSCSGLMSITSRKAGMLVACPKCGQQTLVPMEDIFESQPSTDNPDDPAAVSAVEPSLPPASQAAANGPPADSISAQEPVVTQRSDRETPEDRDDLTNREEASDEEGFSDDEAPALKLNRRSNAEDDMDLTPMVDVTFQLLIFFMVTASFALQKSIEVPTPDPDKKGAAQQLQILEELEGSSIRIQIDATNAIFIDDEPVADPTRLADVLKDKMRKEQKTEALISAHATSLHRWVIAVIDACNSVGMQKIRLVSRQGKSE